MQAGNAHYRTDADLPEILPIFPLSAALLLPGGRMPLNIFEPRYLAMVDHTMRGCHHIGMIQPDLTGKTLDNDDPALCAVGCMGRITSYSETGDGRYIVGLQGVSRFRIVEELSVKTPFRQAKVSYFLSDLDEDRADQDVDREALLDAFRAYLDANDMEADWDSVCRAENATLVNALSMMSPYGPAEKQALLEAPDLKTRAATLVAITEMALARENDDVGIKLQ